MRYAVNDLPLIGGSAFTPIRAVNPVASSFGLVERTGAPGTEPQHALGPTRVWAPPISAVPETQGSNVAPDVWLYDVYIAYPDNMGPESDAGLGMTARRFNPLPIPAIKWTAIPRQALRSRRMGGRAQVEQPRAFQRFPNLADLRMTRGFPRG